MDRRRVSLLITFIIFICIVPYAPAQGTPAELEQKLLNEKNRLDAIKKELSKKKDTIKKTQKKERSVLSQLNDIEMGLAKKRGEVKRLHQSIVRLEKKFLDNSEKLFDLTKKLGGQKEYLQRRLIALYKYMRSGGQVILLSQSSYYDLIKATKLMGIIISNDQRAIENYSRDISSLNTYQAALREDNEELRSQLAQVETKEKEIKQKQAEKVSLLQAIRSEKSLQLAAVKELESSSRNLLELIKRLEREVNKKAKLTPMPGIKGFALMKGKLPFPARGKIVSYFGKSQNEELHTSFFQKGIEIAAPSGSDIKAIYNGRVLYADWLKGYGKIIIIDHGEGYYTLSAHTSELLKKVGDEVKAGETIALVGDTNSLKGSCLYFEIRYHGNPKDPLEWLAKIE